MSCVVGVVCIVNVFVDVVGICCCSALLAVVVCCWCKCVLSWFVDVAAVAVNVRWVVLVVDGIGAMVCCCRVSRLLVIVVGCWCVLPWFVIVGRCVLCVVIVVGSVVVGCCWLLFVIGAGVCGWCVLLFIVCSCVLVLDVGC